MKKLSKDKVEAIFDIPPLNMPSLAEKRKIPVAVVNVQKSGVSWYYRDNAGNLIPFEEKA